MTVLIDSWGWIEFFKGSPAGEHVRKILSEEDEIVTSSMNIAEVYRKFLSDMPKDANRFCDTILSTTVVIATDTEIALHAGKLKHEKKMGMADAIVLATARLHHAKVVTGDDDFKNEDNVIYLGK